MHKLTLSQEEVSAIRDIFKNHPLDLPGSAALLIKLGRGGEIELTDQERLVLGGHIDHYVHVMGDSTQWGKTMIAQLLHKLQWEI